METSYNRYNDSQLFWNDSSGSHGKTHIIDKYNVEYILFNKKNTKNFEEYLHNLSKDYRIRILHEDKFYLFIRLNKMSKINQNEEQLPNNSKLLLL